MVLLSFYHFPKNRRWWAFRQMGLTARRLTEQNLTPPFSAFLGTGAGNGFSWKPDLRVYAHLTVWPNEKEAHQFLQSNLSRDWQNEASQFAHLELDPVKVHGQWKSVKPFGVHHVYSGGPLLVLTRARINNNRLVEFWRNVPRASRSLTENREVLFSKGVGELPWIEQATVSIWPSKDAMVRYAYEGDIHKEIIVKTRKRKWYSEELFAEFVPTILSNESFFTPELVQKLSNQAQG